RATTRAGSTATRSESGRRCPRGDGLRRTRGARRAAAPLPFPEPPPRIAAPPPRTTSHGPHIPSPTTTHGPPRPSRKAFAPGAVPSRRAAGRPERVSAMLRTASSIGAPHEGPRRYGHGDEEQSEADPRGAQRTEGQALPVGRARVALVRGGDGHG